MQNRPAVNILIFRFTSLSPILSVYCLGGYSAPACVHLPVPGPHCRRLHSEVRTAKQEILRLCVWLCLYAGGAPLYCFRQMQWRQIVSPSVLQSQPPRSGPASVALLHWAPVPRFAPDLLQQWEQTDGVSPPGVLSYTKVLDAVSSSSLCLPASPYGPSCLSPDACLPCPCPLLPWASAWPMLRIKVLTWLQETLTIFLFGKCIQE